jgi:predicted ABC-type ATPase
VLAGPNGAGKSTAATDLIPEDLVFLNADELAKTLPDYPSTAADRLAGRRLLEAMDDFEQSRASFAVETTLSGRTLAGRLSRLKTLGYNVQLIYLWAPSPEFSIGRVSERVAMGGHSIPVPTIRRRYFAGLRNFFEAYQGISDRWEACENTDLGTYRTIARGGVGLPTAVLDAVIWAKMWEQASRE